jgi:hypothetical protein
MPTRLIHVERSGPQDGDRHSIGYLAVTASWRKKRLRRLQALANSLTEMRWSSALLRCLVDEMRVDEDFAAVLGDPTQIPRRRYPQAVAIAIALRHSWRPDLFARVSRELHRMSRVQLRPHSSGRAPRQIPNLHRSRRAPR